MTFPFNSRRSPVVCLNGCVACNQPLASQIGIGILKAGGNAADAAVAVAAALNVTEPCSTGIGGDAFCLYYNAKSKKVHGLNGSGRAPANLSLERLHSDGFNQLSYFPVTHGHAVTVPGAAAAWVDTVEKFGSGKLTLEEILRPAVELAEVGFPVQKIAAKAWQSGSYLLQDSNNKHGKDLLLSGHAPKHGDVMKMPHLARTFKDLGTYGKNSFYSGRVAKAIVDVVQNHGGFLYMEDLQSHVTTFEDPISTDYKGYRIWEVPPNGQGIAALMTLNILEQYEKNGSTLQEKGLNTTQYLHTLTEALKLSFADVTWYCADPNQQSVPTSTLLSKEYARKRCKLIQTDSALKEVSKSDISIGNDTVYFTTADREGNACSFINSNFMGFGTGLVPEGCGFSLQNRGCGFSLDASHPNVVAPNKRPYHTIIPSMVTHAHDKPLMMRFGCMGGFMQPRGHVQLLLDMLVFGLDPQCDRIQYSLMMSFGCMGGFMQPQGHVQLLLNMLEFGLDPQQAIDQPRICVGGGYGFDSRYVSVEEGISSDVVTELQRLGHTIDGPFTGFERYKFGKAQIIERRRENSGQYVYWAGSDPRGDGMAIGY